ncbi:response regulator transcription factor [Candidatus Chlorohelix sp.]|uniref:response regulator transcription factor n=1 Tax=Candidatus Chlorohelix sp. TaxID=3139201 RepID=UPI00304A7D79
MPKQAEDIIQVLIVDDHPDVRDGIRRILTTESTIEVVGEATSGKEGVELARKLRPTIALMDIEMPGEFDGLDATRLLKQDCRDCDVLMLTFHDGQEYLKQALLCGASGYILKDSNRTDIIQSVLTVANGGMLIDPAMLRYLIHDIAQTDVFFQNGSSATQKSEELSKKAELTESLTRREREVFELLGESLTNIDISNRLMISQATVKSHVKSILRKLGLNYRTQAAVLAVRLGV